MSVLASHALESYLVRRMGCGYQTRGYGTLALRILKVMADAPADAPVADALREHLRTTAAGADAWPDDEMFRTEWVKRKFYSGLRRDRVLMILRAIEETYEAQAYKLESMISSSDTRTSAADRIVGHRSGHEIR